MRFSLLFVAGLLIVASAFVAARGPARPDELAEDALDDTIDGVTPSLSLEAVPA